MEEKQKNYLLNVKHQLSNLRSFLSVLKLIDLEIGKVEPQDKILYIPSKFYLQSLVLELTIKIFYQLDLKKTHKRTHDIEALFKVLKFDTRNFITNEFNKNVQNNLSKFPKDLDIYEPKLEEALQNNADMVKNFKYTPKLRNGSIIQTPLLEVLHNEIKKRIEDLEGEHRGLASQLHKI